MPTARGCGDLRLGRPADGERERLVHGSGQRESISRCSVSPRETSFWCADRGDDVDDGSCDRRGTRGDSASIGSPATDGRHLEALQPGGDDPLSRTCRLNIIGRVTGFYRRVDEVPAITLTQH